MIDDRHFTIYIDEDMVKTSINLSPQYQRAFVQGESLARGPSLIHGESLARGPKLLSITNYVIAIMT